MYHPCADEAMEHEFKKDTFYHTLLNEIRRELKFESAELEHVEKVIKPNRAFVATVKYNGELNAGVYADGDAFTQNRYGRVRWDYPITDELKRVAKEMGLDQFAVFGELYAVDRNEKPLPLNEVMSIIKNPKSEADEDSIRFAVFDIYSINDDVIFTKSSYEQRFPIIYNMFENRKRIHPVAGVSSKTGESVISQLWKKHVLDENYEGLVIRINGAVKVKPVFSMDVAVIGIYEGSGRNQGRMGGLLTAFMNENGEFLYAARVGTGFSDEDREDFWTALAHQSISEMKVEGKTALLLPPVMVVEIEAADFVNRDVQTLSWNPVDMNYVPRPAQKGYTLQQPRFIRVREDKAINPYDLRLEQVPV